MLSAKKHKFKKIFSFLIYPLKKLNITPNQITFGSFLLSFLVFYFVLKYEFLIALILLVFTSLFDALDGFLARDIKRETKWGAYLDTITDRYVEFIILFSFFFVDIPKVVFSAEVWIALCIFGSLMTTYSKSAFSEKTNKKLESGFIERPERMILLMIGVYLASINLIYLSYFLILFALLTNLSALQRIIKSLKKIKD